MTMRPLFALGLGLLTATALPVAAQERSFNFALRGGVAAAPSYPGADTYELGPDLGFTFGRLTWGKLDVGNGVNAIPSNGLTLRGAFRLIGDRKAADEPELAGLTDIDTAVELGFGLTYRETNWLAFGEVRQGFGGHHGVAGTVGADLILRPNDKWTITAGPRVNFGNTEYTQTYFGVTAGEAATSSFAAFAPDGGVLGAGLEISARYAIDDRWALEGALGYQKLMNGAADSPITAAGSEDQWTVRFGLSRAFTLRF